MAKGQGKRRESSSSKRKRQEALEPEKDWTVMVYLSADNNLSEECVWSLMEMFRAGPNDRVGVVAQIDPIASSIRRFDVTRMLKIDQRERAKLRRERRIAGIDVDEAESSRANIERLMRSGRKVGRENAASLDTLIKFIASSKRKHPAKQYLLVLSGHGGSSIGRSLLPDSFTSHRGKPSAFSAPQIRRVLREMKDIKVLGMDSCGLAMAEFGLEVRGVVDVLVASEGFEINTGWPYCEILTALYARPEMNPEEVGRAIVNTHTKYYSSFLMAGVSTDISACRIRKSDDLAGAVAQLAGKLTAKLPPKLDPKSDRSPRGYVEDLDLSKRKIPDAIVMAHWRAQSYRFERHTDLYDFCNLLAKGCDDQQIKVACKAVMDAISGTDEQDGYVIQSCHTGGTFQLSNGVAVYFPWANFDETYRKLLFSDEAQWGDFLDAYVNTTRRRPRNSRVPRPAAATGGDRTAEVKDNPEFGTRDNPEFGTRDNPEFGTRDNPEFGTRDNPEFGTRDNPEFGTRDNPEFDSKGQLMIPEMKNPPRMFIKAMCYEETNSKTKK